MLSNDDMAGSGSGARQMLMQMEEALAEISSPQCSVDRRRVIEAGLTHFRDNAVDAHKTSVFMLTTAIDEMKGAPHYPSFPGKKLRHISVPTAHFLSSVIDVRGGSLARMQVDIATPHERIQFIIAVRNLLYNIYALSDELKHSSTSWNSDSRRSVLALLQAQMTVAYCRMARCTWANSSLLGDLSTAATDIVADACQLATSDVPANVMFGCSVLGTFCEEIEREDRMMESPLSSSRRGELLQMMQLAVRTIVESVSQAITVSVHGLKSLIPQYQTQVANIVELERSSLIQREGLRCIEAVLSFGKNADLRVIDVSSAFSVDLLRTMFLVIDLASNETQRSDVTGVWSLIVDCGASALGCINEVVGRACWPPGQAEQFAMELASRTQAVLLRQCEIMENLSASRSSDDVADCVLNFRSQLTHFLDTFCANQFIRALRLPISPSFSMTTFVEVMARYTVALPTCEELMPCIAPWAQVASHSASMMDTPSGSEFLLQHGDILSIVLVRILESNFFSSNARKLLQLCGGNLEFVDFSNANNRPQVGEWGFKDKTNGKCFDDVDSSSETTYDIVAHLDTLLKSNEIGELLVESCELLSAMCSISPACAKAGFDAALGHLNQSFGSIQDSLALVMSSPSAAEALDVKEKFEECCWDACASLRMLQGLNVLALDAVSPEYPEKHWELSNFVLSCCESLFSISFTQQEMPSVSQLFVMSCGCLSILTRRSLFASDRKEVFEPTKIQLLRIIEFCSSSLERLSPRLTTSTSCAPNIVALHLGNCYMYKSLSDSLATFVCSWSIPPTDSDMLEFMRNIAWLALSVIEELHKDEKSLTYAVEYVRSTSMLYQGFSKFVFPLGCVDNMHLLSEEESGIFMEQARSFCDTLLKKLCQEIVVKTNMLKSGTCSPEYFVENFGGAIARSCEYLSVVCIEVGIRMGRHARSALKATIFECLIDSLCLVDAFIAHAPGQTLATSSLFNFHLNVIKYLKREVGVEYQVQAISHVLSHIAPLAAAPVIAHSEDKLVTEEVLLRLLIATFDNRDRRLSCFIDQTCVVLRDTLLPKCRDGSNAADLFPLVLKLIYTLVSMHWAHFTTTVTSHSGVKSANPLLAAVGKRLTIMKSAKHADELEFLLRVALDCFKDPTFPPAVLGVAICTLKELCTTSNLFAVDEISKRLKNSFLLILMECLLRRAQPVLMNDISSLLFEIARSDFDEFYKKFLPGLISTMEISNEMKEAVRMAWPDERDSTSFNAHCQSFLLEYRYALSVATLMRDQVHQ